MQTLIDENDNLKKEIKSLEGKIATKKKSPIPKQLLKKPQNPKKTVMGTLRGFVGMGAASAQERTPKQIEAINYVQELLLKKSYDEVDIFVEQNKKLLFGKVKKNSELPTAFSLQDETGETVLMKAIKEGKCELALEWLEKGSGYVDLPDDEGETPLMVAAAFGETEVVKAMVSKANKDAKTNVKSMTALHFAAEQSHLEVVKLLLENGCSVVYEDQDGRKAFQVAPDREIRELIVEVMVNQESGPTEEELKDCDLIFKEEEEEQKKKRRSYKDDDEMRPLFEEKEDLMKQKKRLELQLQDLTRKRSPKNKAGIWFGYDQQERKKVLGLKDDIDGRVKKLHALVSRGAENDAVDEVEELLTAEKKLKNQIDKDAPDEFGETALMKAARLGFDDMVALLLVYKCSTETKDLSGYTALMKAAQFGKKECVVKLVSEGADLNASSRDGKKTALMLAAERSHADICEYLIEQGADHSMMNSDGNRAVDLVKDADAKERIETSMEEHPLTRAPVQI